MIESVAYRDATSGKNNDAARGALVGQPFIEHLQGCGIAVQVDGASPQGSRLLDVALIPAGSEYGLPIDLSGRLPHPGEVPPGAGTRE